MPIVHTVLDQITLPYEISIGIFQQTILTLLGPICISKDLTLVVENVYLAVSALVLQFIGTGCLTSI